MSSLRCDVEIWDWVGLVSEIRRVMLDIWFCVGTEFEMLDFGVVGVETEIKSMMSELDWC